MRVWRLRCDDDIAWTSSSEWGHEESLLFDGRPHSQGWAPLEVGLVEEAEGRDDYDALVFYGGCGLLVSEKARQIMLDAAPGEVEFLSVLYEGQQRWLLNATCVLDCLDLEGLFLRFKWQGSPCRHGEQR